MHGLSFKAASPKLAIINIKKLALIWAKLLSHFNGENLLSHVGGVPYFYPSKPVSAFFFCLDRIDLIFTVLFYFGSSCVDATCFPKWGMGGKWRMLVCGQTTEQGTGLSITTNVLLSPVKAVVFNLYGSDLPTVTKSEVSKQSKRNCD